MNRLAQIDRAAAVLHLERQRLNSGHENPHGGAGGCFDCRDLAVVVIDEVLPALNAPPPVNTGPTLFDLKETNS